MRLIEDDVIPQKTILNASSSMRRLWQDGSPSSERIIQDIRKVVYTNLHIIKEHKGTLIPDLGNRRGNRCPKKVSKSKNWGGNRTKKDASGCKEKHIHPDADAARIGIITKAAKVKTEFDVKVESFLKEIVSTAC